MNNELMVCNNLRDCHIICTVFAVGKIKGTYKPRQAARQLL